MLAGHERDRLIEALGVLRAELGRVPAPPAAARVLVTQPRQRPNQLLAAEDERLVRNLGRSLAALAATAAEAHPDNPTPPPSAMIGAVGGAEMVMRSELLAGRGDRLPQLLPDFVYLVTLPFADRSGARELRERALGLLDGEGPGRPGDEGG